MSQTAARREFSSSLLNVSRSPEKSPAEALHYLDQALDHGFRPGMGRAVADRLFWAESDDDDGDAPDDTPATLPFPDPFNETKH